MIYINLNNNNNMVSVSCFHIHYTSNPFKIIFIKFENYINVILNNNERSIILSNKQLAENKILFQIFILSLLCTKDTSKINTNYIEKYKKVLYTITTRTYWKNRYYKNDYDNIEIYDKNPLNLQEPKRESSLKKNRKFMKLLNTYISILRINPIDCIIDYYELESIEFAEYFRKYINYNKKIYLLSTILHNYGYDIYSNIRSFL